MASEWTRSKLKDVGISLLDCVHKTPKAVDRGHPYIAIPQMKNGHVDFDAGARLICEGDLVEWTKKANPTENDVVLSRRCNPGESAFVPAGVKFALGQNLVLLRATKKDIYPPFLRWLVRGHEWWHEVDKFLNVGAVFDSLRCADVPNFELPIPPLPEQHAIAHILGSLDDKIELNRRMNGTLEGMAQALFKSWFVDFDPVIDNALAAGNPIPESLSARAEVRRIALAGGTANRPAAKPFPAAFQHTEELGWIPEGWEAVSINGAIEVNPRVTLPKGTVALFADMKALPTNGYAIDGIVSKEYSGGAKFQNRDVLLARITPCLENGKTGIVDFLASDSEVGLGSTEFIVLRQKRKILLPYIACLAREVNFRLHCIQSMVGSSGRQRVQNACFDTYHLAIPTEPTVLQVFNQATQPMFQKSSEDGCTIRNLTKLRDTLLPKLISGELRIPDAEKLAKAALS